VFIVGSTKNELGGSHLSLVRELKGGDVPQVNSLMAKQTFLQIHQAIQSRLIRSCHDLSEGGLAVAAAEMAMAGGLGMKIDISEAATELNTTQLLFSESNTRFLVETTPANADEFQQLLQSADVPVCRLGTIENTNDLVVSRNADVVMQVNLEDAKAAWKKPLDWS
jgi:phosphoribosylformylglycinamidine synthase